MNFAAHSGEAGEDRYRWKGARGDRLEFISLNTG